MWAVACVLFLWGPLSRRPFRSFDASRARARTHTRIRAFFAVATKSFGRAQNVSGRSKYTSVGWHAQKYPLEHIAAPALTVIPAMPSSLSLLLRLALTALLACAVAEAGRADAGPSDRMPLTPRPRSLRHAALPSLAHAAEGASSPARGVAAYEARALASTSPSVSPTQTPVPVSTTLSLNVPPR